jgi:hypothetical protein
VLGELNSQAAFKHRFDHLRQETALTGQGQPAGVDPLYQLVEQPGLEHVVDRVAGRPQLSERLSSKGMPRRAVLGHGHLCTPHS